MPLPMHMVSPPSRESRGNLQRFTSPAGSVVTAGPRADLSEPAGGPARPRHSFSNLVPKGSQVRDAARRGVGLPNALRTRVERMSGLDMSDVRVHYNSLRPRQVDALAYTQGTEIHVGPGEERSLAHEAWHVAQQKQGRVRSNVHINGRGVNDEGHLEKEAEDVGRQFAGQGGERMTI